MLMMPFAAGSLCESSRVYWLCQDTVLGTVDTCLDSCWDLLVACLGQGGMLVGGNHRLNEIVKT